jgi:N-acyl-D-amino-acid deacylase
MPEFYRRLRRIGVSREEAVARMTSVPARRFSIRERGIIAKGMLADLIVWREDEFSAESTYGNPHSFSKGVKAVFVNGSLHGGGRGNAGRFIER